MHTLCVYWFQFQHVLAPARIADNTYPSAPPVQTITDKFLSLERYGEKPTRTPSVHMSSGYSNRVDMEEEPFYKNGDTASEDSGRYKYMLGMF